MARWTHYAPLYHPDGTNLKPSEIPYDCPGAYIIAVARGRGEKRTLYVGHTKNLRSRLYTHSSGDEGTWKALERVVGNGYRVFYQVHTTKTTWQAKRLEEHTLWQWWLYPLNIQGNPLKKWHV